MPVGAYPAGAHTLDTSGEVAVNVADLERDFWLVRDGNVTRLPDAPASGETTYCSLNDQGWLAGYVTLTGRPEVARVQRGFVAIPPP